MGVGGLLSAFTQKAHPHLPRPPLYPLPKIGSHGEEPIQTPACNAAQVGWCADIPDWVIWQLVAMQPPAAVALRLQRQWPHADCLQEVQRVTLGACQHMAHMGDGLACLLRLAGLAGNLAVAWESAVSSPENASGDGTTPNPVSIFL